jgi:antitoxin (DNA-binding transcriptional repressor) of toxin-antitoxin stability system
MLNRLSGATLSKHSKTVVACKRLPASRSNAYNRSMVVVTASDIEHDLTACLRRVEAGETVLILRDGHPVAEIRPVPVQSQQLRPYGLCAGEFTVPEDFDEPLFHLIGGREG